MDEEGIDPQVEYINEAFLTLIGEVVKLSIILSELRKKDFNSLAPRYRAFLAAVSEMPEPPEDEDEEAPEPEAQA